MTTKVEAIQFLRQALGDPAANFRRGQWEAIEALVDRRERLLIVERTGWGKSAVYFIATRILRNKGAGPTLIVSPLLALMRNQIEAAERIGIKALTINSTNTTEWPALKNAVLQNQTDALLISPERLANDEFVGDVLLPVAGRIGLLVVDEAHCISDWGHDFRPDYRRLINVMQRMPPNMPIVGTTATANTRVVDDVVSQLGRIRIQRGPLMRETLALQTLRLPDQAARLAWLAAHVPALPGTGIIYTLTKRDAELVSRWLNDNNIHAEPYYSGVEEDGFRDSNAYRQHLEDRLLRNDLKALVATTALGMGYDKPDLAFVIHFQAPGSIVGYYQQVGRAGRGIDRAVGILLSGREDEEIHDYFRRSAFPREQHVEAVLGVLAESDGLAIRQIEERINLRYGQIDKVLKFLSVQNPAPVIKIGSQWRRTVVSYQMDHNQILRLTEQREVEWQEVQTFIDTPECKMAYLAKALDDENPRPCGICASCLGRLIVQRSFASSIGVRAASFLRHSEMPLECNRQIAKDAFETYGFRGHVPAELRAEEGRILSRWGDAGWGEMVAEDKGGAGRFRDELVHAVAEMIIERWKPEPAPQWVTCVPSRNHPTLVPDFARRLAIHLELPFLDAVTKIKDNAQQKWQQNRFHQCRNLDGVFAVPNAIPAAPVVLVDDVIDSGWTMTIIAALLRQRGSGPVWPLALATARVGD